ncbi:MAG: UDP-N-acetylmuramoyl-L-alanyl-D-glutamate--2,6-diaminopimelate ligase [Lachnospiraceae bacterium]|nr:UDP-N-acetylmuramoyl-L-alanyl-D-glutamate--2,6-diaminopimelate ligase [Lachnospiraceae bacterium]
MKTLQTLFEGLEYELLQGSMDKQIEGIAYDSRKVTEGFLFVCIPGAKTDGHKFAAQTINQGASALVVTRDIRQELKATGNLPSDLTVIKVADSRYALAFLSAAWFDHPASSMKIIGITGTKGKTTTTYLVRNILEESGIKTGLIGTIEIIIGDEHISAEHTTPESYLVQEYFAKMRDAGCESVVMEVSSQALMLHRTQGFTFDYGIFTNLSPDHIGEAEHKDFDDYMHCKSLLFQQCRIGIANCDDEHFEGVTKGHTCKLETFGFSEGADYRAGEPELTEGPGFLGVNFMASGKVNQKMQLHTPGRFSIYNALCAIAICDHFGVDPAIMEDAIKKAKVRGRIEDVHVSDDYTLLIDYAHNAMSLESLLVTLREYKPGRLICLFGCGGNRSNLRRFEMGEVSGKLADLTVITSDNPRDEDPQAIIDDIKIGIGKTNGKYVEIPDRREAIAWVIDNAQPRDLIVLAGKGHEDYQEIKGVKYPMDERVIIQEIMEERNRG